MYDTGILKILRKSLVRSYSPSTYPKYRCDELFPRKFALDTHKRTETIQPLLTCTTGCSCRNITHRGTGGMDLAGMKERPAVNGERDAKRVRFDGPSENASEGDTNVTLPAREVVQLRLVSKSDDVIAASSPYKEDKTYIPTYLHQIFAKEQIQGYTSAMLAIYVDPLTLHTFVSVAAKAESPQKVKPTKLEALVARFIKGGRCTSREDFDQSLATREEHVAPVSNLVRRYRSRGENFAVYRENLATNAALVEYHKRIVFFMFVHIDGASFIDDTDPRWELYLVHKLDDQGRPRDFVGYATIYPFAAMRGESGDTKELFVKRLRISQVFVMPHQQRCGHGAKLLEAIYEQASRADTLEVTVEDPSEGFRVLRDLTDLRRAYEGGILKYDTAVEYGRVGDIIEMLRSKLLMTKGQARRCMEVHGLVHVDTKDDNAYKKYRLWVKRRLHAEFLDVLEFYAPLEKKSKLSELYGDLEKEYMIVVERLAKRVANFSSAD